ncbi:MAG: tRNA (N(6)-L-threonylcarbamoyladenosine(37)-C(2))-methylthiotransferase MtaB, partial [Alphaproteobacteria bacterium]|nr:tRNA (N(6)-L-threonylcarbamoyladenosine(37)-C(2))-methylthiotransferase MtaB [Alphaproteobacteria bacterium]
PKILNFGCRLNGFEAEIIRRLAGEAGLADTVIVNSCAVTSEAERQTRQAVRRARRENPAARIVVTGCAVQIDPGKYSGMEEVDAVIGNREKLEPETYAALAESRPREAITRVGDIQRVLDTAPHLIDGIEGRARAFVQVQNGCDHRCTFCIIPFGRGPSRSVRAATVTRQVRHLADNGCREVVISGVDIASYGGDLVGRPSLGTMLREVIAAVPDMPRIRLSSIDPAAIDGPLLDLIADEPRLMPHFHLSIQAGDDLILKRMKRRHNRDQVLDLVAEIRRRRPGAVFGADLIAGFPTETDAAHAATEALVREAGLVYLHVFPYSPRHGTPAAAMPQLAPAVRRTRAASLRRLGQAQLGAYLADQTGAVLEILTETETRGRTDTFACVRLARPTVPGALARAAITGRDGLELVGEILDRAA